MFSRLEMRPQNRPGILSSFTSAGSARYWISGVPSRPILGVQVPKPFDLDRPAGEQKLNDMVLQFLDHQVCHSFHDAGGMRDRPDQLRPELDASYARLYGLTRDELRYISDPKEVPGETFRVLKEKEIKQFGN